MASRLAYREDGSLSFVHGLLRESLLQAIPDTDAPRVARACAAALESTALRPFAPRRATRIARHRVEAGEHHEAFLVLLETVLAYQEISEHTRLLSLAQHALQIAPNASPSPDELGVLHLQIAGILRHLGDVDAARAHIDDAWEIVCGADGAEQFASEPDPLSNPILATLLCEEAIMVFENEADLPKAAELLEIAEELGAAVDDAVSAGLAAKVRSRVLCGMGRYEEGVDAARTALSHYDTIKQNRPDYYFGGLCELAGALRTAGQYEEARERMAQAQRWTNDVGSREALALAAMEAAELARAVDAYDEAREHYRICGELFDALGGKNRLLVPLNRCLVDIEAGDLTRPFEMLVDLQDRFTEVGMDGFTPLVDLGLAACWAHRGGWNECEASLVLAIHKLAVQDVQDQELAGIAVVVACEALEGHRELARMAWDLATRLGGPDTRPSRTAQVARLVAKLG